MLRNRNFLFLWVVTISSTLAIELFSVTVLVTIFQETESTLQAAGTMVARSLPAFLLGPVAGVLVDRFQRKRVLISMDLLRLLLVGIAIWFLQAQGTVPVLGSYLMLAGLASASVFHWPARLALIPSVVEHEELVKANSFIMVSNQIIMAMSYTVGGWLILVLPLRQIALIVAVLFIIAALAATLMMVSEHQKTEDEGQTESFWESFISGWRYLRQHPIARPLTVIETVEHLPHGVWTGALVLAFTTHALQGDASDWGYLVTSYFGGMIVGSLAALTMDNWLQRYPGRIIVTSAFLVGLFTFFFAGSQTLWMAAACAAVLGPPFAIRDVAQDSLLQSTVEEGQLGRVYATREMLRNIVFMFAGLFFAWLSDFVSIRIIYATGSMIYMFTSFYALSNKALRESKIVVEN